MGVVTKDGERAMGGVGMLSLKLTLKKKIGRILGRVLALHIPSSPESMIPATECTECEISDDECTSIFLGRSISIVLLICLYLLSHITHLYLLSHHPFILTTENGKTMCAHFICGKREVESRGTF